ncbi:MAG: DNA-binding protein [Deltaproteobacteria bacterium]|nr:DNA-binding protein [Deltaproteobacteria bacterium]
MKHKLLKSALCLCLLLPACDSQQKSTTDTKTPEKTTPAATVDTQKTPVAPAITEKPGNKVLKTMAAGGDTTPAAMTTDTQKTPAPAVTEQQDNIISGKVLETMDAGGYTYLQVDTGKAQQWVAIPQAKVKVGDDVSYHNGAVMPNFTSKSLNRTFDSIVFSPGLAGQADKTPPQTVPQGMNSATPNPHATKPDTGNTAGADSFASAVKAEAPPAAMQAKTESGGSLGAMAPYTEIKVEKAAGENGYTVAEVFAGNTKLDGKTIRVQGKVVKFSPNIMGKNWIHLQDGSGDPLNNTHDLVITTSAQPPKDKDVITIEGIVRANKDFGAGYSYAVIVEEAKIIQ